MSDEKTSRAVHSESVPAKFFALQATQIDAYWPWIESLLKRVEQTEWTPDDVRKELKEQRAQLWGIPGSLWITRIEQVGSSKRGVIWIAAGDDLKTGLRYFKGYTEPWLKAQGCKYIQLIGRKGWMRVLSDYRNTGIVMEKSL